MTDQQSTPSFGQRGEIYVVVQCLLFALLIFAPSHAEFWPWSTLPEGMQVFGTLLMTIGALVAIAAGIQMGRRLTPLPYPAKDARLLTRGVYTWVRHPMYFGVIALSIGWALYVRGALSLGYAAAIVVFFDIKSRREEIWLAQHFEGYAEYRQRVRKLIPFLY